MSARDELRTRIDSMSEAEAACLLSTIDGDRDALEAAAQRGSLSYEDSKQIVDNWDIPEEELQRVFRAMRVEPQST